MRSPAALLLMLGLIAPMAVAQEGSGGPANAEHLAACDRAENGTCDSCHGQVNASACHSNQDNATSKRPAPSWQDCNVQGETNCTTALARASREAQWITFDAGANGSLANYRIGATTVLDAIQLVEGWGNLSVDIAGKLVRLASSRNELQLHDDPTGLMRFKADNGSLLLTFPAQARIQDSTDGRLARVTYPDGTMAHFRTGNSTWVESHVVLVQGFGSLAMQGPAKSKGALAAPAVTASAERAVGAEVSVGASTGESQVLVLAYDDVDVNVQMPDSGMASIREPIRVSVASGLPEGRTVVVNLARQAIANASLSALQLRYFDVHEQKGGAVETELIFGAAGDLSDVLDPTDDGGQPEYWLVEDLDGIQLLVSVPRWSEHIISIALAGATARLPDVALGIGVGIVGSLAAAIGLLRPRRYERD